MKNKNKHYFQIVPLFLKTVSHCTFIQKIRGKVGVLIKFKKKTRKLRFHKEMFDIKIINSQGKQSKINQKMTKKKISHTIRPSKWILKVETCDKKLKLWRKIWNPNIKIETWYVKFETSKAIYNLYQLYIHQTCRLFMQFLLGSLNKL